MDVTSEEIRSSRFQGTRHVYDRREVDAFLHRAASTLEIYERKLTVTESHVENLEKALELAQSRARSMSALDARIAELEAALAASQHNYESAMSELEARAELESSKHQIAESEHELQVKLEAAEALKTDAAQVAHSIEGEARATADALVSSARSEAEEILRTALLAQTSILEEVEEMRLKAEAGVAAKLEELRALQVAEHDSEAQSTAELEQKVAAAEERVSAAEAELAAAEDRGREALAKAEADLEEANNRAATAESRATDLESELATARQELSVASSGDEASAAGAEVEDLRRQVAQMRTALANIQTRFASAAKLSPEELELATALVDLDLHDVDLLVDLTTPAMTAPHEGARAAEEEPETEPEDEKVAMKSKWAQAEAVPAGALTEGRADVEPPSRVWPEIEKPAPNWRDTFGSARKETARKAAETVEEAPLGFYERRLAGLRDRIRDAGGDLEK